MSEETKKEGAMKGLSVSVVVHWPTGDTSRYELDDVDPMGFRVTKRNALERLDDAPGGEVRHQFSGRGSLSLSAVGRWAEVDRASEKPESPLDEPETGLYWVVVCRYPGGETPQTFVTRSREAAEAAFAAALDVERKTPEPEPSSG